MAKTDAQCGHVSGLVEKSQWHERIFRDLPLDDEEEGNCRGSADDQGECVGTVPRMRDAASLKTEKKHHHSSDNGDNTEPVDGFDTGNKRRLGCLYLQEEDEQEKGSAVEREIDIDLGKN